MRASLIVGALAVIVVVGVECKRTNGAYCDDARPCANGLACDLTTHECHPMVVVGADLAGLSTDMAGCACSGPTPICVAGTCESCMSTSAPDAACAAISPSTPHCASDGTCVGCRDMSDCSGAKPFCDAGTHVCRGCVADSECPSLICDLTPNSMSHGVCIDSANVVYADAVNGNDANMGLTPTTATKTIMHAINNAVGLSPPRLYVHAATGTYPDQIGVNGKTIYVVGAPGAIIHTTSGGKDAIGAQSGGSMTVRNLIAEADSGNGGNCNGASFTAYQTQFINSGQDGIVSSGCTPLLLDGCTVSGNTQGGVVISSGDFTIVNSIIVKNMGVAVYQTVAAANTILVNDTIADNSTGAGVAGIHCALVGSALPVNTILYNNRTGGGGISETDCTGAFLASDDPTAGPQSTVDLTMQMPGFVGAGNYHLMSGSPCINEGTGTMGAPNHDFDFEPRPDATKMLWDIGADEVQ